jgi:choline-sulfatase
MIEVFGTIGVSRMKRLAGYCLLSCLLSSCAPDPPDNIVLISLDTVRRDHLSTYGYERATTPRLDSLASEGILFMDAFSQATNTAPSHASMLTGLYPQAHGVVANADPLDRYGATTMAEILGSNGFRTAGFVSGYTMESKISGLDRGFEIYDDEFDEASRDGRLTLERALEWLTDIPPDERFFLFFHLFDAHGPYQPSAEYAELFKSENPGPSLKRIARYQLYNDENGQRVSHLNRYVDRYDAQIRYLNDLVATLLENLDLSNTIVIVAADHGETLGERRHAMDHGGQVHDEQIRIPLLLRAPNLESSTVEGAVETIDLMPTILELLQVTPPEDLEIQGKSLVPLINGEEKGREFVFSMAQATKYKHRARGYLLDEARRIKSVRTERWKLIRYPGRDFEDYLELYDLHQDPQEKNNVVDAFPEIKDKLLDRLKSWEHGWESGVAPAAELDPDAVRRMQALGYLGD